MCIYFGVLHVILKTQQTDQKAIQMKTREDYFSSKFLYKEHTLKLLRSYCSKALLP